LNIIVKLILDNNVLNVDNVYNPQVKCEEILKQNVGANEWDSVKNTRKRG